MIEILEDKNDKSHCRVISEIGINHNGSLDDAYQLLDRSKSAGCWGVKFQYRDVETFYNNTDEVADALVYEELKRSALSPLDLRSLGRYSKKLGIKFGVSLFRVSDLSNLDEIGDVFDFYKVPSAECLNSQLIKELIKKGKLVFVSTGGSETMTVLQTLLHFSDKIIPMHCISNYPSKMGGQDINVLTTLLESGFSDVGYSSHDENWEVCLLAIAFGARWIERHITLDKNQIGLDHSSSSDLHEMKKLVEFSKSYKSIVGNKVHSPNQGELINVQNLGTSLYAKKDLNIGDRAVLDLFEIKAPRTGISVGMFTQKFQNIPLSNPIKKGTSLNKRHFESDKISVPNSIGRFARETRLGLPVRLHDYQDLKTIFDVGTYEFHLSFTEVMSGELDLIIDVLCPTENISVHLPDYIPGTRLLDPISRDRETRALSRSIIKTVSVWSKKIEQKIGKKVHIIGSFSGAYHSSRSDNLNEIFAYIAETDNRILPQWLPVYAWYFGGNVKLNLFNSIKDIEYIVENNCKICLDVSHLVMAASYYNCDWVEWFRQLETNFEHLHLSDAGDSTSEGLMIGDGIIGDFSKLLSGKKLKIIECWQGHMNGGEGFWQSLKILQKQFNGQQVSVNG